jgi:hypothetical protein
MMNAARSTPYLSQNWLKSPYESLAEDPVAQELSNVWSGRSCGIACVSMILLRRLGIYVRFKDLLWLGLDLNAYCARGWIHAGLSRLLGRFGIRAEAMPLPREGVEEKLRAGCLVIVSVSHKLPIDGARGGHLILLHGIRDRQASTYVAFSDPSRWGEVHQCVTSDRLFASYSGRAIVCEPLVAGRSRC